MNIMESFILNKTHVQHPKQTNDMSIMHLANTQITRKVTMNQKDKMNCVQMYLGVQYVSKNKYYQRSWICKWYIRRR